MSLFTRDEDMTPEVWLANYGTLMNWSIGLFIVSILGIIYCVLGSIPPEPFVIGLLLSGICTCYFWREYSRSFRNIREVEERIITKLQERQGG